VLAELEVEDKPVLQVLNKVDLLSEAERAHLEQTAGDETVLVSGMKRIGLDALLAAIDRALVADPLVDAVFRIPQSDGAVIAALEAGAVVSRKRFDGNLIHMRVRGPASLIGRYRRYRERTPKNPVEAAPATES